MCVCERERERGIERVRRSFTIFFAENQEWKSKGKKLSGGSLAYPLYIHQEHFKLNVIQFPRKINWSSEVDFNLK